MIACNISATSILSIKNVLPNQKNANIGICAIEQWKEIYLYVHVDMRRIQIRNTF